VTCERCFSKLKMLKTRLRSRMSDEYLNDAMIIAVERETSDNLDPEHILDKYAKSSVELVVSRSVTTKTVYVVQISIQQYILR
ncbi:Primosomal protein N', partial [Frankliniella fusca]